MPKEGVPSVQEILAEIDKGSRARKKSKSMAETRTGHANKLLRRVEQDR